jgi:O-methyltransferase
MSAKEAASIIDFYDLLAAEIDDPAFVFMNHGYANQYTNDDLSWLRPEDTQPTQTLDHIYKQNLARQLFSGIELSGKRILDIGSGRGGTCSYLVRYHNPAHVIGFEKCAGHVEFCRKVHRYPNVEFVTGDAMDLPYEDGSIDIVSNLESSHCYPDLNQFYDEVYRVLCNGGLFCYTDPMKNQRYSEARKLLEKRFTTLSFRDITPNVIKGLTQLKDAHKERVRGYLTKGPAAAAIAGNLLDIPDSYIQLYSSGAARYYLWQLQKD